MADKTPKICGSGLACDANNSVYQVYRGDAIAGKPAPTKNHGIEMEPGLTGARQVQ
ncbi:hypothetical protein [Pseudomonas sp. SDO524_S393]